MTTGRAKTAQPVGVGLLLFSVGSRFRDGNDYFFLAAGFAAGLAPSLALVDLGAAVSFLAAAGFLSAISVAPLIAVRLEKRDHSLPWHPQWQRSVAVFCVETESSLISIHYDLD